VYEEKSRTTMGEKKALGFGYERGEDELEKSWNWKNKAVSHGTCRRTRTGYGCCTTII
jgi:hypothetical protein